MKRNPNFELIEMAGEYTAVPTGSTADTFFGVVVLNEAAYFMLSKMDEPKTKEELVKLITDEYKVEAPVAEKDIEETLQALMEAGVVCE